MSSIELERADSNVMHQSQQDDQVTQAPVERAKEGGSQARNFTFQELADATENFSSECLLDVGSYGKVYRAKLEETGQIVTVERLDKHGSRGNREFLVEVLMLNALNHPNLINLVGYCAEGDEKLLVREYMPLGSLLHLLHDTSSKMKPLEWNTRVKIALGIASGLNYLHFRTNPPIILRNLKPSSVLLDNDFNAKLSDLGLAKLGPTGGKLHVSTSVKGTFGYISPEYEETGLLSVKADVYSFGVVLIELVTGQKAIEIITKTGEQNLISWACRTLKDRKKFPGLADPRLEGDFPSQSFKQVLTIAAMCLQEEATARPMMSDVVTALLCLPKDDDKITSPASSKQNVEEHIPLP